MEPIIRPPAYRHGLTAEQILHAFRNPIAAFDQKDEMTMLIGGDHTGALLEIDSTEGPVIIHAMKARDKYLR
ncbi:MAG TPA: hypothetical protein VGH11_01975 [Jatrophihabitans sp.]|jgi:hypothetical protein